MQRLQRYCLFSMTLVALVLLAGCGVPGVVPAGHALPTAGPTATAAPLPPLRLPQDEAPHTDMTEWWYYTGHFQGKDATGATHQYGFELTFFQVLRGGIAPIYIGHYAITDITRGTFQYDQRLASEPNAPLPNGTTTTGFNLAINTWTMQGVNGQDHLVASLPNYAIALDLASQKPAALHNGNGLITYGIGGFSYYYSRTHMAVSGTIQDHGATIPVTGLAWMDHQWGNFVPTVGIGWDWFSIQLANDTEYMIYRIRDSSGTIISVVGSRVDAQGATTAVDPAQISEQATGSWTSPTTHITYPSGWNLTLPGGALHIAPDLPNQELVTTSTTGNTYWEGACAITGILDGQTVTGQGYTELTGYGT
jgi:predicted secreted hydrolase